MLSAGDLVVCVDDAADRFAAYFRNFGYRITDDGGPLKKGNVYTVRDVLVYSDIDCIRLVEIVRKIDLNCLEPPYIAAKFRPIGGQPSELVSSLLVTSPLKVDVA